MLDGIANGQINSASVTLSPSALPSPVVEVCQRYSARLLIERRRHPRDT